MIQDNVQLTIKQSLPLVQQMWNELVYCGMNMENRDVTPLQTEQIINHASIVGVSNEDVEAVLHMNDGLTYVVNHLENPLTLEYASTLQGFIARNEALEWGVLRTGHVGISRVTYRPPVPIKELVEEELGSILSSEGSITEQALDLFLWAARGQFFWDGNKRTALLLANKHLVQYGRGVLTIQENSMEEFSSLLTAYYESGDCLR